MVSYVVDMKLGWAVHEGNDESCLAYVSACYLYNFAKPSRFRIAAGAKTRDSLIKQSKMGR